jgi:hypothetical protein
VRAPDAKPDDTVHVAVPVAGGAALGFILGGPPGAFLGAAGAWVIDRVARGANMLPETQMLAQCREIIAAEIEVFEKGATVQVTSEIPPTDNIPIQNPQQWLRIPDVICVFIDMKDSTRLSAATHDKATAAAYQLYTGGAVRLLDSFEPAYIVSDARTPSGSVSLGRARLDAWQMQRRGANESANGERVG